MVRTTAYDLLKSERRRGVPQAVLLPAAGSVAETDEDQLEQLRDEISRLDPHLARMIELRLSGSGRSLASPGNSG